jgi:hypothetical protein
MARLKDRQRQIPNGYRFQITELNFVSTPFSSFTTVVNSVYNLAKANEALFIAKGWPTEYKEIEDWVDDLNAAICEANGWHDYFVKSDGGTKLSVAQVKGKETWPLWAKALALTKKEGEIGLGDTVERLIGHERSDAFKAWYKTAFGKPCGCSGRKAQLNREYAY